MNHFLHVLRASTNKALAEQQDGSLPLLVVELNTILEVPSLNKRRCFACGNVAWHADNKAPYVCCRKCGSQDTRIVKDW